MNNKQLIVIVIAIIVGCCIISGTLIYLSHPAQTANTTVANNTTVNITENETDISGDASQNDKNSEDSDDYVYSPQSDSYIKKSGQYVSDDRGNKVYQWQGSDGVIYEKYYDSNGREISTNEYMS